MASIDAVCSCGKDMTVEPQGEFIRLSCACGQHKLVNVEKLKGGKDTQPLPVITKTMTESDIDRARERIRTEDTRDGFSKEPTVADNETLRGMVMGAGK